MKRLACLLVPLALLLSACEAGPEYAPGESPHVGLAPPLTDPAEHCLAVPGRMMDFLKGALREEGVTLRNARAYRAGNFVRPFFVAAEIDGPGMEDDGQVATWSATALTPGDGVVVMAEDDLAARFSTLPDARVTDGFDRGMFVSHLSVAGDCVRDESAAD
ncbi:MAG TPA: hypothetical protein VHG91_12845 [Longimicrobium sp.]|nr:hypothetical protein [Longimicrobium sp.]